MKITISKTQLIRGLYLAQSIVERKTTMPILANVLLSASDDRLKISSSDLEITAVVTAQAKVEGAGSTTVNSKVFSDIVRELPEGDITLRLEDGERLEILSHHSTLRMIGVSADEYPSLPGIDLEVGAKINSGQLVEMISKTIYAVSSDETRFNLNGICFSLVDSDGAKLLRMVATDGHRLSMITRPVDDIKITDNVIVPRKGLMEIKKIVDEGGEQEIGIDVKEGFLLLETDDTKISMRLIDGEFPDYKQVVPKDQGVCAVVNSKELIQSLRRVALMVTDKGKCVKMDFAPGNLKISSSSPELGDAQEEMDVSYSGEPLSIGFNARYLLDIASALGEDQPLTMELNGPLGPGKFYSENDQSCLGVVMPMRLP